MIRFRVGGLLAPEAATWHSGTNLKHDLTVTRERTVLRVYLPFVSK